MRRPDVTAFGAASIAAGGNIGQAVVFNSATNMTGASPVLVDVAAKDPQAVYTSVALDRFTGRGWLAALADEFMSRNPCGYLFIEAEAGLGKTAFAAWLVRERGYLSHFSQYAEGRSERAALGNLSAQLIKQFSPDKPAPDEVLPPWAQAPAGFETQLGIAAEHARGDNRNIVLVVDGLDEAGPQEEGLPFGLPSHLPEGVFVIGTYRSGRSPGRPGSGCASQTIRIRKDDPRNQADVTEYLSGAVAEERLADRLAKAGADPAEFTRVLAERCDGVWVYLRCVIDEVRLGLRQPGEVADLPTSLRDYYADQVRRWQRDSAWDNGLLDLAATLAVAREPLPVASLARLAGDIKLGTVRRWCDFTLRPFVSASSSPYADSSPAPRPPQRYELFHASFREFLTAVHGPGPAEDRPSEVAALADELADAASTAHGRIAASYLTQFGGLDTGLPLLADNLGGGCADDGYPLRHLAYHLEQAGRSEDLHRLLAAERLTSEDHAVNVWFAAHEYADCIDSYPDDLDLASCSALAAARGHVKPAASVGRQIRYALMKASIISRAASIPTALLKQAVRTGFWSPARGLDHARRVAYPYDRFLALDVVLPHLPAPRQREVLIEQLAAASTTESSYQLNALARLAPRLTGGILDQALTVATAAIGDHRRASALTALAAHLPAEEKPAVLAQALTAATAITDPEYKAEALTSLAGYLPAEEKPAALAQALTAATPITDDWSRAQALRELAPHLPASEQPAALTAATAFTSDYLRALALTDLVPHLPADEQPAVLALALTAATAITDDWSRARALTDLVPHLPPDEQPAAVAQALADAKAITDADGKAHTLAALAPHLPADLLSEALKTVTAIRYSYARGSALAALAPRLPADLLAQALTAITADPGDIFNLRALAALAPRLPASLLSEALKTATAISQPYQRAEALIALMPHLPSDEQTATLAEAFAAAKAIRNAKFRAEALTALVPHVPADEQPAVLAEALAAVIASAKVDNGLTEITVGYHAQDQEFALAELAPYLSGDLLAQAIAAATSSSDGHSRSVALAALSRHLPAEEQTADLAQALAAATTISNISQRATVLIDLVARLPDDLLAQALRAAAAISNAVSWLGPRGDGASVIIALAPRLPPGLLIQAYEMAAAISDADLRAHTLARLAPHLPAEEQPAVLAQALTAAKAITEDSRRAETLANLAPHLPAEEQPAIFNEALAAASAITEDWKLQFTLTGLAAYLPADILAQAVEMATAIGTDYFRAEALAALARYLPSGQQRAVLATICAIENAQARARVLTNLAPHLPAVELPAVLAEARTAATAITDAGARAEALTALAPHLPAEEQLALLHEALQAVAATTNLTAQSVVLEKLVPHLPADLFPQALQIIAAIPVPVSQSMALQKLAPHLPADFFPQAFQMAAALREDLFRDQALADLMRYVPADLFAQAFKLTSSITSDQAYAAALAGLARLLPPEQLADVLAAARPSKIGDPLLAVTEAVLYRGFQVLMPLPDGETRWLELLKDGLNRVDRPAALKIIKWLASEFARIGGVAAIRECIKAIEDVHRWWP